MCLSNQQAVRLIVWCKRAYHRYHLSHIILLASYLAFIIASATVFFLVESLQAKAFKTRYLAKMTMDRRVFVRDQMIPHIFNNSRLLVYIHDSKSAPLMSIVNERLESYEHFLKLRPPMPPQATTFPGAVAFIFSIITTLGGHSQPMTPAGRVLAMAVSIIGIPFTMIVIKDLAFLLAKLFHLPCKWLEACWAAFRFCTLRSEGEDSLENRFRDTFREEGGDYRMRHSDRLLLIPVAVAIFALLGWATLGTLVVRWYAPRMDASLAFYHVFNSLTTIGLRELEGATGKYQSAFYNDHAYYSLPLLLLLLYILVGLAIVSLFINLLHSKFSVAYWLPGRMHIPLPPHHHQFIDPAILASFDSDDALSECAFNHYTTLGVLQTDDKCPLICLARRDVALADAITQTPQHAGFFNSGPLPRKMRPSSPEAVLLGRSGKGSRDNVGDLIVETYSSVTRGVETRTGLLSVIGGERGRGRVGDPPRILSKLDMSKAAMV